MANYNKKMSETNIRIGEVRFSYANVFKPRANQAGTDEKYGVQILIPKTNDGAKKLIDEAIEAAKQVGVATKWNGKMPAPARLNLPLRDGDAEFPDDPTYEGMWFMNANASKDFKPGVRCLDAGGNICEALDGEDFYSGCWGCVTVGMFAYSASGNMGVACGLNNLLKTRDDKKLGGSHTADDDFGDLGGAGLLD